MGSFPSEALSSFVIPAKPREAGRERDPGFSALIWLFWIPDLAMLCITRPE
jgi:hypothetical protein